MKISLWDQKGELQKDSHSPEHLCVLIRNPDTSQVGNFIECAPGSGAAGTDGCDTDWSFLATNRITC